MNTATSESRKTTDSNPEEKGDRVRLKKQLGLLEGVAIILGIIFGSGKYLNKIIYYYFRLRPHIGLNRKLTCQNLFLEIQLFDIKYI